MRREGDALVIACPRRDVRIDGGADFALDMLQLCDGRRSIGQLLEARSDGDREQAAALIAALLEQRALVDGTEAWRVLHEQSSIGSPLFPDPDASELEAVGAERHAPALAADSTVALAPEATVIARLAGRRASATPADGPRAVSFAEVSALLETAYRRRRGVHAPVASAGSLYPLVFHLLLRAALGPLEPGIWWYDHEASRLGLVRVGPPALDGVFVGHEISDGLLGAGGPVLVISADIARAGRKYGNRAYRFALIEAGSAWQNAALAAAELGVPARPLSGFSEDRMDGLLEAGDVQSVLAVVLGA